MSFESLVDKLSPKLKGIVHKLNGHFTFFNDEDLYQEALIHLWTSWTRDAFEDKTDSYILQGCYFFLKNYLRMALDKVPMVRMHDLIGEDDTQIEDIISITNSEPSFDSLERQFIMDSLLHTGLTDKERKIVSMVLDGLTVRQIGEQLGISHVMVVKMKNMIKVKCAWLFKNSKADETRLPKQ